MFAMICIDKPGALEIRMANRPQHLEHLNGLGERLVSAGPLLDDAGTQPIGSLIVLDVPDRAAAQAIADADPYSRAGLFETVLIRRWRRVLPQAPGQ